MNVTQILVIRRRLPLLVLHDIVDTANLQVNMLKDLPQERRNLVEPHQMVIQKSKGRPLLMENDS